MIIERDARLDAARGLGMLFVVYGHLLEPVVLDNVRTAEGLSLAVYRIIYAFHMPFFFLVTGMIDRAAARGSLTAAFKTTLNLVLTAFLFSAVSFIPQWLVGSRGACQILYDLFSGTDFGLAPLWFLPALALIRFVYAIAHILSSKIEFWCFLIFILDITWICSNLNFGYWQIHTIFGALPFYLIGRFMGAAGFKTSLISTVCGLGTLLLLAPQNFVHFASNHYGSLPTSLACALGGSYFALYLVSSLRGIVFTALAQIGYRSFDLFITSGIILAASPSMRSLDNAAGLIVLATIGIPIQIALSIVLHRPIAALRRIADRCVDISQRQRIVLFAR